MPTLEVSLSPALYPYRTTTGRHVTVVIDVLRFTTSVISAFENKVLKVIPVSSIAEAKDMKNKGFPVAAELNGLKLPFADFGNSATDFITPDIKGQTLVYSTTNGTGALKLASENGLVVVAAFTNLITVSNWLLSQDANVVILCSGWKNLFCIEDTLCAGALSEYLIDSEKFTSDCDSVRMACSYWKQAENNPADYIRNASHYNRLLNLGVDPLLNYTLMRGSSEVLPVYKDGFITDLNSRHKE